VRWPGFGLSNLAHQIGIDLEGQHAVVVAIPVAFGVFGAVRNGGPGGYFVGLDQAGRLGRRAEGEADVDGVGGLRAFVVFVGLNGLNLVAGSAAYGERGDGKGVKCVALVSHAFSR